MPSIPDTMAAVLLTGHGGFERLEYRADIPVPAPDAGQVLIEVGAAGVNNTDINTRVGWYSKAVEASTNEGGATGFAVVGGDGGWNEPLDFPRIQGADCCGRIVAVGDGVSASRIGERVLVRSMQGGPAPEDGSLVTFGSEMDGGFAEYAVAASDETWAVESTWSDVELASLPCASSTAEGLLDRAELGAERVLITGASGGVGSAAIQLAKLRGAHVVAVCGATKADQVRAAGADEILDRGADLATELGENSVDVVVDLVAGPMFGGLPFVLRPGGRYAVSGAVAGPIVALDVRDLYLKDLTFVGSTWQPRHVFDAVVRAAETNAIRPLVAATYPLAEIVAAQERFLTKDFVGKIVLEVR